MESYVEYWGLEDYPFENVSSSSSFYAGKQHAEALERMCYMVRDGNMGIGLLTGESGCGKSTVVNVLEERMNGNACLVVKLENPYGDFDFILREILNGMNRRPGTGSRLPKRAVMSGSRYELLTRFRHLVDEKVVRMRRQMVIVIDEAQKLSPETLVELKNLMNFNVGHRFCVSIILAGQPELGALVRSLPQIEQRVGVRYHLKAMNEEEVGDYVDARMHAAGYRGEYSVFTDEAKRLMYTEAGGIPREVNRLCRLSLDHSFCMRSEAVESEVVRMLVNDMMRQSALAS
ncbi:MAG: AAA family ATPase [Planctomycetes bacterium]|nr:AAA family ATPase [Planctomycetota bacterium]